MPEDKRKVQILKMLSFPKCSTLKILKPKKIQTSKKFKLESSHFNFIFRKT
jgi:hypothetical protein